jgi:chemotaxis protein methyltransferase CheR
MWERAMRNTELSEHAAHRKRDGTVLSSGDFIRLSNLIYSETGIKMPEVKKTMLEARLHKRIKALNLRDFDEYCDYLFSEKGMETEFVNMIDLVTTNKTDFFREPDHFDYLLRVALPELLDRDGIGVRKRLTLWSSACSTGEEPYTLAMVTSEFREKYRGYHFFVLATDISTRVLEKGRLGVYDEERADPIPSPMKKKYLLRSKDRSKKLVKIDPSLRCLVEFKRLNLMDAGYDIEGPMHIIFCRNVIIYFDRPTQERLINRMCRHLAPQGYLFMGHSENLHGLDVPLVQVAPTVYRRL